MMFSVQLFVRFYRNWEDEVVLTGNVLETGGESICLSVDLCWDKIRIQ